MAGLLRNEQPQRISEDQWEIFKHMVGRSELRKLFNMVVLGTFVAKEKDLRMKLREKISSEEEELLLD